MAASIDRCALCARWGTDRQLVRIAGMKGRVCGPGYGCDQDGHPPTDDVDLNEVIVDNPHQPAHHGIH